MADKVDDKGMIRILVYGTLKRGHANHRLIEMAKGVFLGYDKISGPFRMVNMTGFPGIIIEDCDNDGVLNTSTVRGELWGVDPEGLAAIDMLEGHPSFYKRVKWWTDSEKRAWVYTLSPHWLSNMRVYTTADRTIKEGIWRPGEAERKYWEEQAA
jgi:gamma-glutamylcyclotransferase (GGCT)/AIG2-like uncharacterized protein YtfP